MTCHLTPGMSPLDFPFAPPMHSTRTSSCSSISLIAPSPGAKAVICLPFFTNCTLTHFLKAELGCFASNCTFSRTMPLPCEAPPRGSDFSFRRFALRTYTLSYHLLMCLLAFSFFPAFKPRGFFPICLPGVRTALKRFRLPHLYIYYGKIPAYNTFEHLKILAIPANQHSFCLGVWPY